MNEIADSEKPIHRQALDWLNVYAVAKEQSQDADKAKRVSAGFLKPYLELNGPIVDGETGWKGELGPAPRTRWFDFESLAQKGAAATLLKSMAERGLLTLNFKAYDALGPSEFLDAIKGYVLTGEGTRPIRVTKEDLK